MELREFIREALTEIDAGVHEANEHCKLVRSRADHTFMVLASRGPKLEDKGIEFDVAVTTTSEGGGAGKAKVNIAVAELSLGGGG